jgi:hypothetical protein
MLEKRRDAGEEECWREKGTSEAEESAACQQLSRTDSASHRTGPLRETTQAGGR